MLYRAMRPLLFGLDPERAHRLSLASLDTLHRLGLARLALGAAPSLPVHAMGLDFPNPVGLAPGLDKNGEYVDALAALGFGFIEIGAVTPRPQPGHAKPRLFRLPQAEAIINRMGFNNAGVDRVIENVRRSRYRGILGINIGKNADTPADHAADDYLVCLRKVYPVASFVTANVSSPNTPNLRSLQGKDELDALLRAMMRERNDLVQTHGRSVPLAVKIAPDLDDEAIEYIAELLLAHRVDAVIATNTTTSREGVANLPHGREQGGLSGAPLRAKSTEVVAKLQRALKGRLPIIGVGGIASAADAREKLDAGATLVQLYTALIYRGPELVGDIVRGLAASGRA
ncbi:MAG: dihydroorotate dehydrogenase (quinone) [Betaproteobacteria bacterium RIFCSPLOWO2_12_FULL_63_13]|nr:MAG: dihydroorotate dehydrogenase (quinone) [Betaproteobacteria bacterium RIFCSPLOWO2_02_FULL_63_19]OGA50772.1 MAG: dihydroorotate dehydrogenase (quinone) [Betaproteobacteria bacterium RIFCSPLOWO2_12_FULL_63_13]